MTWLQLTTLASGLVAGATLLGKLVRLIAAIQTLILRIERMQTDLASTQSNLQGAQASLATTQDNLHTTQNDLVTTQANLHAISRHPSPAPSHSERPKRDPDSGHNSRPGPVPRSPTSGAPRGQAGPQSGLTHPRTSNSKQRKRGSYYASSH